MKVSTKGRYALEIAADLAMHSDSEHRESLKNIARRRDLSEKYLERIVKMLCRAGIVSSASEGELAPVPCLTRETDCGIECGQCPTREVWGEMWEIIKKTAGEVTVADLQSQAPSQIQI